MIVDIFIAVILLLSLISGYLGGGYREIVRIFTLVCCFVIYSLDSVRGFIIGYAGSATVVVTPVIFIIFYFVISRLSLWLLSGLIEQKEGITGGFNKMLGLFAGLVKFFVILLITVYTIRYLQSKGILVEFKFSMSQSFFFSFGSKIIELISA